jgi:hypothetical protein
MSSTTSTAEKRIAEASTGVTAANSVSSISRVVVAYSLVYHYPQYNLEDAIELPLGDRRQLN